MTPPDHDAAGKRGCGGDVAAYALGALEPHEAEALRAHLETCAICRDELAAFTQVVDALPMSAPQHPVPRRVRRRVLTTVRNEARARSRREGGRRSPLAERLSTQRLVVALGAVLAVIALVLVGIEIGGSGAGKPATRVYAAQVTGLPGSAEVRVSSGQAELIVRHFPPPPSGKIYEVWVARQGGVPAPTGALFSVGSSGSSDVALPTDLSGVKLVLVTPEPDGGTRIPTHAPVITARLS